MHDLLPFKSDLMPCDVSFASILFLIFFPSCTCLFFCCATRAVQVFAPYSLPVLRPFHSVFLFFFFDNALDRHADVTDTMIVLNVIIVMISEASHMVTERGYRIVE